jgi:phage terminase large subunit-like protein
MRLGLWTQHEAAWMRAELWDALPVVPGGPALGELVALGFDGSTSGDATALVAWCVEAARVAVLGLWERPEGDRHWAVPRAEVVALIDRAFSAYRVSALFADPWGWRSELQELAARYRGRVVEWNTAAASRMGPATDAFMARALQGQLTWDGNARLRAHVISAIAKPTPSGDVLIKDARHPQHIDLAIAAILAHEAGRLTPAPAVARIY